MNQLRNGVPLPDLFGRKKDTSALIVNYDDVSSESNANITNVNTGVAPVGVHSESGFESDGASGAGAGAGADAQKPATADASSSSPPSAGTPWYFAVFLVVNAALGHLCSSSWTKQTNIINTNSQKRPLQITLNE